MTKQYKNRLQFFFLLFIPKFPQKKMKTTPFTVSQGPTLLCLLLDAYSKDVVHHIISLQDNCFGSRAWWNSVLAGNIATLWHIILKSMGFSEFCTFETFPFEGKRCCLWKTLSGIIWIGIINSTRGPPKPRKMKGFRPSIYGSNHP